MCQLVSLHVHALTESLAANVAGEGPYAGVDPFVRSEVGGGGEGLVARLANVRTRLTRGPANEGRMQPERSGVAGQGAAAMTLQGGQHRESVVTHFAGEWAVTALVRNCEP